MFVDDETIFAPITAPGRSAVSLVRVSGREVPSIARALIEHWEEILEHPRMLKMTAVWDLLSEKELIAKEGSKAVLDYCLVVYFKAPKSFTGEHCLEFNLHGSTYLAKRLIENLTHLGARLANPGEFSQRAYLNGLVDLTQAEAVADLIAAETEAQASLASAQLSGKLTDAVSQLGEPLRDLLAEIEAFIDFPEEGIEPLTHEGWSTVIDEVLRKIECYLTGFSTGKILREGASVVIAGPPNAGKSSLLNLILGENRAIVTPIPGTTRDTIEEHISLGGLLVRLTDTAGIASDLRSRTLDQVERLGVERSWKKIGEANLVLFVIDGSADLAEGLSEFQRVHQANSNLIVVVNKEDLLSESQKKSISSEALTFSGQDVLFVSAKTGKSIEELLGDIRERIVTDKPQGSILISNERHFQALQTARSLLASASDSIAKNIPPEFIALDLRSALNALNEIIGVTDNEEILGRIFTKFCIGK